MSLEVTSLNDLDTTLVGNLQTEFSQMIAERYPALRTRSGVLQDLVLYLSGGVSGAVNRTEIARIRNSGSLLAISQDPELADPELVDAVLSNFNLTRKAGEAATGYITIVVTDDVSVVVPAGALYSANGVTFAIEAAYVVKPTGSTALADTERVLAPAGDNTYSFTIPAAALTVGDNGNIRRGTRMTPSASPARFVYAVAATDFSGGFDTELNDAMVARLQAGVAAKVIQGRINILALLSAQEEFAGAIGYSVIGYGDPEMLRDQHSIFPGSSGGRVDIYARTAALPLDLGVAKTATLIDRTVDGDLWQVSIQKIDAPGFYEAVAIYRESDVANEFALYPTVDTRGYDLPDEPQKDVISVAESAYSAYQTAVIRFLDSETSNDELAPGDVATYTVVLRTMPLISELQEFVDDEEQKNVSADVLVKAAVPCFLTLNCEIDYGVGTTPPEETDLQSALATAVNNLNFPGRLHMSLISEIIHNFLTDRQAVSKILMRGRIRRPFGEDIYLMASDVLEVPSYPEAMVTGKTTAFILYPDDISIAFQQRDFGAGY